MLNTIIQYLSVFLASAVNMNYGLGLSITYGLSRLELFLFLSSGSVAGIVLALMLGARIRDWWRKKFGHPEDAGEQSLLLRVWRKYGLMGLAFFSFLMGPIPPVAIALLSGMRRQRILAYLATGKFLWAVVFAFLGYGQIQRMLAMIFP